MLLTFLTGALPSETIHGVITRYLQSRGPFTGVQRRRFYTIAPANSTGQIPMRSSQVLLFNFMYGRIFETPLNDVALRKRPQFTVDKAVQAWRNGERATNPHSDKYRKMGDSWRNPPERGCMAFVNAQ